MTARRCSSPDWCSLPVGFEVCVAIRDRRLVRDVSERLLRSMEALRACSSTRLMVGEEGAPSCGRAMVAGKAELLEDAKFGGAILVDMYMIA